MTRVSPPRSAVRLVAAASVLVTIAGLVACSSAGGVSDPALSSPRATATAPPTFTGVQHPIPTGEALKNEPKEFEQIRLTGCSATASGWKSAGTAHNATNTKIEYRVVVLFTDAQARAIDSASVNVVVPAGQTRTWTASRTFSAPEGTRCVVRSVRAV